MSKGMLRRSSGSVRTSGDVHHQHVAGWRWTRHTPPWLGTLAVFGLTLLFRSVDWGAHTAGTRIVALLLFVPSIAALSYVARQYAKPRFPFIATHLQWTIIGLGALFVGTLLVGPATWWCWVAGFGGATLCLSWNVRSIEALRSHDHESRERTGDSPWDRIGLSDMHPKNVQHSPGRTVLTVVGERGKGAMDMIRARDGFTNLIGARPGGVQVVRSLTRANEAQVIVNHVDHLSTPTPRPSWDGRYRSVAEGIPIGVYEDGEVLNAWLAGRSGQAPTLLQVMGMTRSGKSHLFRLFALGLSECYDATLWVSDTVKASQTLWPLLPAIDRLESVKDGSGTRRMIQDVQAIVTWRSDYLGGVGLSDDILAYRRRFLADDERLDAWKPECGLSLLVVWLEEAARVLPNSSAWTRVCESGLSTGVVPIDSMQRADYSNKPTGARAQVASGICFGVNDPGDSSFVLGPTAQEASQLHEWKTRYPGRFMADCMFADPGRIALPLVTFWSESIVQVAERSIAINGPRMARLTPWEINVCSTPYVRPTDGEEVTITVRPSVRPSVESTDGRTAVTSSLADAVRTVVEHETSDIRRTEHGEEITEDMINEVDPDGGRHPDDVLPADESGLVQALSVEDGQPVPGPCGPDEGWTLPNPNEDAPDLTAEEAHGRWVQVLQEVWRGTSRQTREGYRLLLLKDLVEAYGPSRSRPWIHERLNAMVEADMAVRFRRGVYALTVDPHVATIPITQRVDEGGDPSDVLFADIGPDEGVSA